MTVAEGRGEVRVRVKETSSQLTVSQQYVN